MFDFLIDEWKQDKAVHMQKILEQLKGSKNRESIRIVSSEQLQDLVDGLTCLMWKSTCS